MAEHQQLLHPCEISRKLAVKLHLNMSQSLTAVNLQKHLPFTLGGWGLWGWMRVWVAARGCWDWTRTLLRCNINSHQCILSSFRRKLDLMVCWKLVLHLLVKTPNSLQGHCVFFSLVCHPGCNTRQWENGVCVWERASHALIITVCVL